MTARHVERLLYPRTSFTPLSAARSCRRDLADLYAIELLDRLERRVGGLRAGSASFVYGLSPLGARLLAHSTRRHSREPGLAHLAHVLAVTELVVRLHETARSSDLELLEIQTEPSCWRILPAPHGGRLTLKPDLRLTLGLDERELHWFVEIDRGSEHRPVLTRKCQAYVNAWRAGQEQRISGVFPRVLWVVPDQARVTVVQSVIAALTTPPAGMFEVTTEELAIPALLQRGRTLMIPVLRNLILIGDARQRLESLPDDSIDTVVTSPPYVGLRNYGHPGQIGAEPSVGAWIRDLLSVLAEVARVLKPTGTLWLNLGDAYARKEAHGALPKSRLLAPEQLVLALARDGWVVRNVIAWHKPNPTPASVADRFTNAWEPVYLLTRNRSYFFDLDAVRLPHRSKRPAAVHTTIPRERAAWAGPLAGDQSGLAVLRAQGIPGHPLGKNPGDVWSIPATRGTPGFHAAFPESLAARALLAGCPERVCLKCGLPWQRQRVERRIGHLAVLGQLLPGCDCQDDWQPGLVLDPFMGSGTTAVAAEQHHRDWLGIELNPKFVAIAERRITHERLARPVVRSPDGLKRQKAAA